MTRGFEDRVGPSTAPGSAQQAGATPRKRTLVEAINSGTSPIGVGAAGTPQQVQRKAAMGADEAELDHEHRLEENEAVTPEEGVRFGDDAPTTMDAYAHQLRFITEHREEE
jgi:hypothetical protein